MLIAKQNYRICPEEDEIRHILAHRDVLKVQTGLKPSFNQVARAVLNAGLVALGYLPATGENDGQ